MRRIVLAVFLLALPAVAGAQPIQGLYIGGAAGGAFLENEHIRLQDVAPSPTGKLSYDAGFAGLGSIGYAFGNGVRVEIEGDYRSNDRSSPFQAGVSPGTGSGWEHKYGVMANVLFDMDIGSPYIYPYLGAGAGWQEVEQSDTTSATSLSGVPGTHVTQSISGTEGSFAYQAMAGLSFPIPGMVGLSATAEYRFLGLAGERTYNGTITTTPPVGPATSTAAGRKVTNDYNHAVLIGLRYAFNVPPPAPPPAPVPAAAPAPAAARTYLVFFDWDKADLTDRARQIIADAAQASTHVAVTKILVNGYTDLSGTPAYNQVLSVKRAQAVAAQLVRDGVPQSSITTQGFGQTHPLVPTAAGVREPQNRRVEIILQ